MFNHKQPYQNFPLFDVPCSPRKHLLDGRFNWKIVIGPVYFRCFKDIPHDIQLPQGLSVLARSRSPFSYPVDSTIFLPRSALPLFLLKVSLNGPQHTFPIIEFRPARSVLFEDPSDTRL